MDYSNSTIPKSDDLRAFTRDIADTLQIASNSVERVKPLRLCVSDKVNMFSLNKPLWRTCDFHTDDPDWQKGAMNYGIIIPSPTTVDNLPNSKWSWDKPTGGAASPYRLQDFEGYKHKCPTPYYNVPSEMFVNKDLQNNVVRQSYPMSDTHTVGFDKYKVQLSSASGGNQNFYAAIWVRDQSNDGGYIKTYEAPINGNDQPIDFSFVGLPEKYKQGTLKVCCFISNKMQTSWISATRLPLEFLCWGGYGIVDYTTYVSTYVAPAELTAYLDRNYTFIDTAEAVNVIVKNIRTDGKSIDLGDETQPSKAKLSYEVTSASGETFSASNQYFSIIAGSRVIAPNQTCTIRFDRMVGYTENGQQVFPPDGFTGTCFATLLYGRRNDYEGLNSSLLINIQIPFIGSSIG